MNIRYSGHALKQMVARGISATEVETALHNRIGNPTPGEVGTIWIWGVAAGGRRIKVCVRTTDQTFVITAACPDE